MLSKLFKPYFIYILQRPPPQILTTESSSQLCRKVLSIQNWPRWLLKTVQMGNIKYTVWQSLLRCLTLNQTVLLQFFFFVLKDFTCSQNSFLKGVCLSYFIVCYWIIACALKEQRSYSPYAAPPILLGGSEDLISHVLPVYC